MPDPDYTISMEQQQQLVRKKLAARSLQLLNDKYQQETEHNELVRSLKSKLEADMELLNEWKKDGGRERSDEFYHDYRIILDEMRTEQRQLLKMLNKKEGINDDIIRDQLELLDIEEEKMRRHFLHRDG